MSTFVWNDRERDHYTQVFALMRDHLDEKGKRLLAASMALSLGAGSHTAMRQVTGMAMDTLQLGVAQLTGEAPLPRHRVRRPGGGDASRLPRFILNSCRPCSSWWGRIPKAIRNRPGCGPARA